MLLKLQPALLATLFFLPCCLHAREESAKSAFFLPQNPVAAAYVLGRLSDQELIDAPRSEFVYVALLERKGLARKYRLEALDGLSRLRHSERLTELLNALSDLDKKGDSSVEPIRDLVSLLLESTAADLAAKRDSVGKPASQASLPLTRQGAFAALIRADGSLERAWSSVSPSQRADLLVSIPLLPATARQAGFYATIEPLLSATNVPEILQAAIVAISAVPEHERDAFVRLAGLVEARTEVPCAIISLQQIPRAAWPREGLEPLTASLLEYLQSRKPAERTEAAFTSGLQLAGELASLLPADRGSAVRQTLRRLGPAVFVIRAVYEQMRFDNELLVVEPAKPVVITLKNEDAMPHNLAVLSPGALEEIGLAAEKMTPEPDTEGRLYLPASPKVLQATKLVAPGQKAQLAFAAPNEPGEYPFVCTFPGHWRRMTGILAVTKDVDGYIAAKAQTHLTEWKLEELAPALPKTMANRDLATGASLFTKLACIQCHRLGHQGYAYGPDLSDVFERYKKDHAAVLEQILEPSKIIAERYRVFEFELKDDEPVLGMVVNEDNENVTVQSGPADSLIHTLKKANIRRRESQKSSPMPLGLLNTLSQEQIFDLLAYIETGGKNEDHRH